MRKFILQTTLDTTSFEPKVKLVEKRADGEIEVLYHETLRLETKSKYTREEQEKIDQVNDILKVKGIKPMSEEEADFMLDPAGINKRLDALAEEMEDPEVLQRFAGFKVEKIIRPID